MIWLKEKAIKAETDEGAQSCENIADKKAVIMINQQDAEPHTSPPKEEK